jgi:NADPH:quinone reductase-like Zn-dependent oxidoreductase
MKAIVFRRYGGPEVLEYTDVDQPSAGPGQALVRVRATSINAADYRTMRADPFLVRLDNGLRRPKKQRILGSDVARVVEQVGEGVDGLELGDEVFGDAFHDGMGAFAELVAVRREGWSGSRRR